MGIEFEESIPSTIRSAYQSAVEDFAAQNNGNMPNTIEKIKLANDAGIKDDWLGINTGLREKLDLYFPDKTPAIQLPQLPIVK